MKNLLLLFCSLLLACSTKGGDPVPSGSTPSAVESPTAQAAPATQKQVARMEGFEHAIQFELPTDWYANPAKHPFELQYFSKEKEMNTGIFVYDRSQLAKDLTIESLLKDQVNDIRSKRKNFKEIRALEVREVGTLRVASASYTGEKGTNVSNYRFCAVEFSDQPGVVFTSIQACLPESWAVGEPILTRIVDSAMVVPAAQ